MGQRMAQLFIGFLLTFSLSCSSVIQIPGVTGAPKVTLGKGKLGWVHFPGYFTRKDSGPGITIINTLAYEVRKLAGSSDELIFGMSDYHDERGEPKISDDFYAVTLDGKFKSRRATSEDWKNAGGQLAVACPGAPDAPADWTVVYRSGQYSVLSR